jgi:hypothetical protein
MSLCALIKKRELSCQLQQGKEGHTSICCCLFPLSKACVLIKRLLKEQKGCLSYWSLLHIYLYRERIAQILFCRITQQLDRETRKVSYLSTRPFVVDVCRDQTREQVPPPQNPTRHQTGTAQRIVPPWWSKRPASHGKLAMPACLPATHQIRRKEAAVPAGRAPVPGHHTKRTSHACMNTQVLEKSIYLSIALLHNIFCMSVSLAFYPGPIEGWIGHRRSRSPWQRRSLSVASPPHPSSSNLRRLWWTCTHGSDGGKMDRSARGALASCSCIIYHRPAWWSQLNNRGD